MQYRNAVVLCIALLISLTVCVVLSSDTASSQTFTGQILLSDGNGLYSSLHEEQIRKNGMPTRMWPTTESKIDKLSDYIGKTVYLMPDKVYMNSQPIETLLMAVYRGIEIGNSGQPVLVGAVILKMNYHYQGLSEHYQSSIKAMDFSLDIYEWTTPSVSCSFDSLTNPKKVYYDEISVKEKLLSVYKSMLESNLSDREKHQVKMDKERKEIQSTILRLKMNLKENRK